VCYGIQHIEGRSPEARPNSRGVHISGKRRTRCLHVLFMNGNGCPSLPLARVHEVACKVACHLTCQPCAPLSDAKTH